MRRWIGVFAALLVTVSVVTAWSAGSFRVGGWSERESPFGVLFSVDARVGGDSVDAMFAEAKSLGVGWVRTDFFWDVIEPERDVFQWTVPDRIVAAAEARSIRLLAILDYSAMWASSDPNGRSDKYPPRQTADFARYVAATVTRYRKSVSHWQVWNEPDLSGFWRGSAERYAELLTVSYRVIKTIDPKSVVVLGGLAQGGDHDPAFLKKVLTFCRSRSEPCFDIMAFHTNFRTMRGIRKQFDMNRAMLARYGIDRPIWVTESSYTSDPQYQVLPEYRDSEASQARYLGDALTLSVSLGAQRVFWAGLHDYDPTDAAAGGLTPYTASGLVRADGRQKPAYVAYQRLVSKYEPWSRRVEPSDTAGRP